MGEAKKGWSLQGMTASVTGGTSGIGLAIVEEQANFGAMVHTCTYDKAQLDQCLHRWKESGLNVTGCVRDVSIRASRERLPPSFKVSNARKVEFKPTIEFSGEDLSTVMATNLEAAYQLSQLGHPLLKATVGGYLCWDCLFSCQRLWETRKLWKEWSDGLPFDVSLNLRKFRLWWHSCACQLLPTLQFTDQVIAIDGGSSVNGFYPLKDHQKAAETVHASKC